MNPIITVEHVLTLFPHRKKSWAYQELRAVRDAVGKRFLTLDDLVGHFDLSRAYMEAQLLAAKVT
jgi:hypothetical protein